MGYASYRGERLLERFQHGEQRIEAADVADRLEGMTGCGDDTNEAWLAHITKASTGEPESPGNMRVEIDMMLGVSPMTIVGTADTACGAITRPERTVEPGSVPWCVSRSGTRAAIQSPARRRLLASPKVSRHQVSVE
jgi:hypothetical protein